MTTETVTAQIINNMTSGSTQNQTDGFEDLIIGTDQEERRVGKSVWRV